MTSSNQSRSAADPSAASAASAASDDARDPRGAGLADAETFVAIEGPLDLPRTLALHGRGAGDTALRIEASGSVWRTTRTAAGPATLFLQAAAGGVRVRAWGPGAAGALAESAAFVGAHDDPDVLVPRHPVVADAARRFRGVRIGRTGAVFEALVPAILEQKITGDEARRTYRALLARYGEPAPGPAGLRVFPAPSTLAALPYHAFHPLGLERRRAELVRTVAREASRLERLGTATAALDPAAFQAAYATLRAIPGIGPWTAAEVGLRAFGDPDAVSVGDFHVPNMVCWALAAEPRGTDARMLELLEPYHGQRGRVIRLLELSGAKAPRYGPRMPTRRIADL